MAVTELLPPAAASELVALEARIAHGLATFLEVGAALVRIRDGALYRAHGYRSFSHYLNERWRLTRQRAYQLIDTAEAVASAPELSNIFDRFPLAPDLGNMLPSSPPVTGISERFVRELAAAPAGVRLEVVRQATAGAHPRELRALMRQASAQLAAPPRRPAVLPDRGPAGLPDAVLPDRGPAGLPDAAACRLEVADARALPLPDDHVAHIITSPPYCLGVSGQGYVDFIDYTDYLAFVDATARELLRVTRPGGRLAINLPVDKCRGGRAPVALDWLDALRRAGWSYRSTVVWREGNISYSAARGSVDSPEAINLTCPDELILVLHKGAEWRLPWSGSTDLDHEEWVKWPLASWKFWGEPQGFAGYPACFPIELPHRLLKLLTFCGDLVLDPFMGTATTGVAALRLGRPFVGFDANPQAVALAHARLANEASAAAASSLPGGQP